ncbi:MAG: type II toxin-antitoxin system VapC family toxin [Lewinellaceae bacterium]|nr:type II toxin-antitoxin system VapC family toxin [Lewinellaceae bacterium]
MVMKEQLALDTNIAIDILNGNKRVIQLLEEVSTLFLPVTVCGELLFGAKNSGRPVENEILFRQFINACTILSCGIAIADTYSEVRKKLKDKGRPIPENDIWIAATCIVYDIPLATRDQHFKEVDGLELFSI